MSGGIGLTLGKAALNAAMRDQILREAMAYKGSSSGFFGALGGSTQTLTDGTVYMTLAGFLAGDTITNVLVPIAGAGSGVTLSKAGVVAPVTGVQLGISADQGTAWQSTGMKVVALGTPYVVPSDGALYLAVVAKASTTVPSVARGVNAGWGNNAIGSGYAQAWTMTGQTDIPDPCTFGTTGLVNLALGWS